MRTMMNGMIRVRSLRSVLASIASGTAAGLIILTALGLPLSPAAQLNKGHLTARQVPAIPTWDPYLLNRERTRRANVPSSVLCTFRASLTVCIFLTSSAEGRENPNARGRTAFPGSVYARVSSGKLNVERRPELGRREDVWPRPLGRPGHRVRAEDSSHGAQLYLSSTSE